MKCNTRFLYSVWRNRDDKLMILDGTADECAEAMGCTRQNFYRYCNENNHLWTIQKRSIREIEEEAKEFAL